MRPLLFLSPRVPEPLNTGAKIRTHALLGELRKQFAVDYAGFLQPDLTQTQARHSLEGCGRVTLVAERAQGLPAKATLALCNLAQSFPVTIAKYGHRELRRVVRRWMNEHPDGVVHADHIHMAPYLGLGRTALRVIDEHNVEARILERLAGKTDRPLARPYIRLQARRMRRWEGRLARQADLVLAVSPEDGEELAAMAPETPVEVIPNGVNLQYFRSGRPEDPDAVGQRLDSKRLVFTGSMNWLPNQDAVVFFCESILPLLAKGSDGDPDWQFTIVGLDPPAPVRALADEQVRVTGSVPDVRPYIDEAAIYVVPLRIGGGSRLKILEAFAMGIPVVSTTVGCEGLGVEHGNQLLIADTPEAFAREIERLKNSPHLADKLTQNARTHAQAHFSWVAIGARLTEQYQARL